MWQIFIAALAFLFLLATFLGFRYLQIIRHRNLPYDWTKKVRTLVVLGSGGHTAEMLKLMDSMDKQSYTPRCYVVAATDSLSGKKALAKERDWNDGQDPEDFFIEIIPRSREVGQSYLTSVITTIYAFVFAMLLVWRVKPALILVNGPGTCLPVCVAAFGFRMLGLMDTRLVYIESIARVFHLSLTGKILYLTKMSDLLIVQWEKLHAKYPHSVYAGSRLY